MEGGLITIPIHRGYQQRKYYAPPPQQAPPQLQKPINYQPQQNVAQPQQNPADPNKDPSQAGQVVMFDGKRMRKAVHRKTVDYNSAVIKYLENRCWQRDDRDARAIMPDSLYQIEVTPPMSMITNPTNCVTTKFIRTSTNKFRCPIFCLAWTPEGRRLVTGASSGEFTLWNGLTFNFETILQAHDTSVRAMVWSNNDAWMVTGDHSGFIKYWQTNMNNVKMFQGHKEPVRGISFAPSDNKFTTCSDDGTVRIWDFQKCHEEKTLRGHGADVKCVSWHPQKSLIASGSKDNQQPLKLWDTKSGQCLATIHAHKMTVMQLQWNKNGNWLLTASRDHLIKLFDIRNMKEEVQTFKGHKKEATAIDWHPIHEGLFVSGGSDGAVMFWHVGTDRELGGMEYAHEGMVWSLAWHPLGHILASGSNDHTTKFWTRNRPGDRMRDRYNLNQLNGSEHELPEFDLENTTPIVTAMSSIPGVNEGTIQEAINNGDMQDDDINIPGLDWETDSQFLKDHHREQNQRRKIPYSRPIDREFVHAWRSNKQPPSISGEKIEVDKKPKVPLPSLLDLPSMKPAGDFDLETLKDEEGDKQGRQLRQGRNKDYQREKRGMRDRDRDRDNDRERGNNRDRDKDRGPRHTSERNRNESHVDDDFEERMAEESLIEMQERMDNSRDSGDDDDHMMDRQDGMMGNRQGMMGNQFGAMRGKQGMMGNPKGMMTQGMMGNQQGMMGNQHGMIGNQQGRMGSQHGMMGNQQGMMGIKQGMMGNQGLMDNLEQGMMGNPQGMLRSNQQGMMAQNRQALMGNQPGIRVPNPGLMGQQGMIGNQLGMVGQNRPGFMGNRPGMGGPQGNRIGGAGQQGGQRMPLLGQGPGMGSQGGPGANRPFNQDVDFRDQNQGPSQRGSGPVDKDMRNQDSDFRNKQDSDFRDKDNRQRKGDSKFGNDRENKFQDRGNQRFDNQVGHGQNRQGQMQNRQEEIMDFDDRDSFNRQGGGMDNFGSGRNRDGGGRGGGRGGRGGWRGGR